MALGVKNVTKAHLKKKPCPTFVGIYYISKESLPHLFEDFKKDPLYHSINLLLNETINAETMQLVADNKKVTERLSYFGELLLNIKYVANNIGLICREDDLFVSSLKNYNPVPPAAMASRLLEAIVCGFHDHGRLVFYFSNQPYLQETIKDLTMKYQSFRESHPLSIAQKTDPKTLRVLVVDRRIDLVSPLVRNFYYLNMISDVFRTDFDHQEISLRNGAKIKLSLEDPILSKYKNLHISKLQKEMEPDFKTFKA